MFSFEGTPLENRALGWKIIKGTTFFSALSWSGSSVSVPGRDESIPAPATLDAPVFPIVFYTRKQGLESLLAMWALGAGYITDSLTNRRVKVDVVSVTPAAGGPADLHVVVSVILRVNGVFWRDANESTSAPKAVNAASVVVPVMAGLSAPVRDAIIRVKGRANGLQVRDSRGSYFRYTLDIAPGSYFRFESATGRAFITTHDAWVAGDEVTGFLVNGPGAYPLQISPKFIDPSTRSAELTVTTTARSGAAIEVRGRRAYVSI